MHLTPVSRVTTTLEKVHDSLNGYKFINQYCMLEEIGRGTFGKVKLCQDDQGQLFALKIVRKPMQRHHFGSARRIEFDAFKNEVEIMKTLNHENVVRLYEVIDAPEANKVYLVMEFLSGGQIRFVDENDKPILSLDTVKRYFRDLAAALAYLHDNGIIHRDIKPENLMLSGDDKVKVCDFGSAQCEDFQARRTMGSPAFFAPELCTDDESQVSPAVDVWAAGLTLFMFVFGHMPFDALSIAELQRQIVNNYVSFPWPVDPQLEDLILQCLRKDPKERIEARDIPHHPWMLANERRTTIAIRPRDWAMSLARILALPVRLGFTFFSLARSVLAWILWNRSSAYDID